jgi:cell division protein FtsW
VVRIYLLGQAALRERRAFDAYLCFGVALMFSGQAFVNMGVSSGLLPTKGLTLPLVSYGGTSVITSCALLGMVLRVAGDARAPSPSRRAKR